MEKERKKKRNENKADRELQLGGVSGERPYGRQSPLPRPY